MTTTMIPTWSLQDRLRKARQHAQLEQDELAERIGVSPNTISNYETGRTTRHQRVVLRQWALATGVPLAWIIEGDDIGPDSPSDQAVTQKGWIADAQIVPLAARNVAPRSVEPAAA